MPRLRTKKTANSNGRVFFSKNRSPSHFIYANRRVVLKTRFNEVWKLIPRSRSFLRLVDNVSRKKTAVIPQKIVLKDGIKDLQLEKNKLAYTFQTRDVSRSAHTHASLPQKRLWKWIIVFFAWRGENAIKSSSSCAYPIAVNRVYTLLQSSKKTYYFEYFEFSRQWNKGFHAEFTPLNSIFCSRFIWGGGESVPRTFLVQTLRTSSLTCLGLVLRAQYPSHWVRNWAGRKREREMSDGDEATRERS